MKRHDIFEIKEKILDLENIVIKKISIANSKAIEANAYVDILNLDNKALSEVSKLRKMLSKLGSDIVNVDILEVEDEDRYNKVEKSKFLIEYIKINNSYIGDFLYEVDLFEDNEFVIVEVKKISLNDSELSIVEKYLNKIGNKIFKEEFSFKVTLDKSSIILEKPKEEVLVPKVEIKAKSINQASTIQTKKPTYTRAKKEVSSFDVLDDILIGQQVRLRGEIFFLEVREIKSSGNILVSLYITDGDRSVVCTKFLNPNEEIEFKVGSFVEVEGRYNSYGANNEFSLVLNSLTLLDYKKEERKDEAPNKRVELCLHTNMSELASLVRDVDVISVGKNFGHKAIAVTDYGVVHGFPFVAKELGKSKLEDFKIIYGIEAYVVDDIAPIITNPKDINLSDEEFVVFDIETTGFSPEKDRIIEIGAVKIKNNKEIDSFSVFVNPEIPIPAKITEITSITDSMVANAETIQKVLPDFLKFCGEATLVAHNARFDIGFINKKCEQLGIDKTFSYIDTLEWSKILVENIGKYNLAALTKHFNISLENHHRAVDDANATAKLFQKLLTMVFDKGVIKLSDINDKLKKNPLVADTENTTILVKNLQGLKRLYELVSSSHIYNFGGNKPRILKSQLLEDRENFLISSVPIYSGRFNKGKLVEMYIRGLSESAILEAMEFYDYVQIFPRSIYADAISQEEIANEDFVVKMNEKFVELAKMQNKLVVATGNVNYMNPEDAKAKAVIELASNRFSDRIYNIDTRSYFRTTNEMLQEFSYLGESLANEVVITNTNLIADQIEKIKPIPDGSFKPVIEGAEEEVREMTYRTAHEIYGPEIPEVVKQRIERELNAIIGNGFAVLYLIAQKLVKKSVDNGYIVGSRGSVGSSLVAYLMKITEVNALYPHYICDKCKHFEMLDLEGSGVDLPDKKCPNCNENMRKDGHSIPFEVFMGFKGDKVPDIDLNFSGDYQGEVHKYTKELFGDTHTFRAGTIGTLAEKNSELYVKKYFEKPIVAKFEREIYEKYKTTLAKLPKENRQLEEVQLNNAKNRYHSKHRADIKFLATKCVGVRKTTGQHPGGMIVIPNYKTVYDFSPIQYAANKLPGSKKEKDNEEEISIITHFDYHVMDEQLVKLDILGHDDPTTVKYLEDLTGLSIYDIPLVDEKVISLFSSTKALGIDPDELGSIVGTNGIPEFGTPFVKKMLEKTKPKSFAELVRISGLSHGTDVWTNNAEDYVDSGVATLSSIITVRDDIMNHLIDMKLDNSTAFSIMEFVRKGQPSKNKEKWEEYKEIMRKHNIEDWYIESCEKIKYMFPKGHAVAYVMMAIRIAYFKVYHPLEFYTAYLSRKTEYFSFDDMYGGIDKIKRYLERLRLENSNKAPDKQKLYIAEILLEMALRGIELLPIDIYASEAEKFKIENGKIRIPLISLDALGKTVANAVVEERNRNVFTSIQDLRKRTGLQEKVLDALKTYGGVPSDLSETDQMTLF